MEKSKDEEKAISGDLKKALGILEEKIFEMGGHFHGANFSVFSKELNWTPTIKFEASFNSDDLHKYISQTSGTI
jgi:hypothetical protein